MFIGARTGVFSRAQLELEPRCVALVTDFRKLSSRNQMYTHVWYIAYWHFGDSHEKRSKIYLADF
eukprot:305822-Pelagomonas_calceolata.AAC.5